MENSNENKFDQWALVEIFGHVEFAGHVTEEQAFGVTLARVDVPETSRCAAFTKLYGASAIFCITPLGEAEARAYAESLHKEPINEWRIPHATVEILGDDGPRRWDSHSAEDDEDDGYGSPDWDDHSDFDDDDESQQLIFGSGWDTDGDPVPSGKSHPDPLPEGIEIEPGFQMHSPDEESDAAAPVSRIDSEPAPSDLGVETLFDDDLRL